MLPTCAHVMPTAKRLVVITETPQWVRNVVHVKYLSVDTHLALRHTAPHAAWCAPGRSAPSSDDGVAAHPPLITEHRLLLPRWSDRASSSVLTHTRTHVRIDTR